MRPVTPGPLGPTLALLLGCLGVSRGAAPSAATPPRPTSLQDYREFALRREGDVNRGRDIFADEPRAGCTKCHAVDGRGGKAGPERVTEVSLVPDGFIRNVEGALRRIPADAKIIPGHGPLSPLKEWKEFHEMLVETSGILEKAIADGKTLNQVKADGLPDRWKSWAFPTITTERWLETLYRGLSRK